VSHNTFIHRLVRPVVRAVAPLGVTPNQITTLRLVTGLAAAFAFAKGGPLWPGIGAAIFVVSMLLDRADGELARQTGQSSVWGYRYDLACDFIAGAATFIGIGYGLTPVLGPMALALGLAAGAGIGALFWELNVFKLVSLRPYSLFGGRIEADPDDAMIFVPILIWCGASQPMLLAAAVITPLAALGVAFAGLRARSSG
jgi:archaetidylinositol phosphate synthase